MPTRSAARPVSLAGSTPGRFTAVVAPVLLVAVMAVSGYSVVRYRPAIVLCYVAAAVALAAHLGVFRRLGAGRTLDPRLGPGRAGLSAALALAGLFTWFVPGFTYLDAAEARTVRAVLAVAALMAAAALASPVRRAADLALSLASTGYLAAGWLLIRGDPAPSIDVWYTLQGAADTMAAGNNIYSEVWLGPPGVMAAFTYLPWTAVLLAPGRWLAGDVRWALIVVTLVAVAILRALPERRGARAIAPGVAALLLVLPGTATQVEQAWTEPLLLSCLAVAAWALRGGRTATAILALAVGMACKQHLALLLPLLAVWPRFGPRRAALTAAGAGVLVLPWLVADPRAFLDDTVALLVRYPPMRFADSLYVLAINETGWVPPFWITAGVVLTVLGAVALVVHRTDPDVAVWLRWVALVLLVANLVNKQAFYNQYWLVAALVLVSWAAAPAEPTGPTRPARPAAEGSESDGRRQPTVEAG